MRLALWARRIGLALLLAWAAFILGWAPWFLGGIATTRRFQFPDRENAGLTPKSFELAHEDVAFQSSDGVPLKGWWVGAPNARGSVVLVHGLNRSRIEMVKKTPFLAREGWNALLFDLRNHGESGGDRTTLGSKEKQDVKAALAYARAKAPGLPLVVWGVSLGGASATFAAAEERDVAGLVCDSSYRSLRDTVRHHVVMARGFRWWTRLIPQWPAADIATFWMGRRGGFDPDAIDVVRAARALQGRPALFVCNSDDRRMPKEIAFELKEAAGARARVLVVPGTSHGGAYRDATSAYEHAVSELLSEAAGGGGSQPRLASR